MPEQILTRFLQEHLARVPGVRRLVVGFSGGLDSTVLLHLAIKAFWPAPVPFSLLHVDTGHNLPEVLAFRDEVVARHGLRLHVAKVERSHGFTRA